MKFLSGKKTYVVAAVGAVLMFLQLAGVWTPPVEIWEFLGVTGVVTMRLGVAKSK